jgi:hypothetical protein
MNKYIIKYFKLNEYLGSVEVEATDEEKALGKAQTITGWTRREINKIN